MVHMQMEPWAMMNLSFKERGCMSQAGNLEVYEQGFQAQTGKRGGRWMQVSEEGGWAWWRETWLCLRGTCVSWLVEF